jgi:hypothetical protein
MIRSRIKLEKAPFLLATRKYARSVRLPDGDLAGEAKRAGLAAVCGAEHSEAEGMAQSGTLFVGMSFRIGQRSLQAPDDGKRRAA